MIIKLTQSHIDRGCRGDAENCPAKHAITEATGIGCIVGEDFITLNPGVDDINILTPPRVTNWIVRYDRSELVEPFEFELDVEGVGIDG